MINHRKTKLWKNGKSLIRHDGAEENVAVTKLTTNLEGIVAKPKKKAANLRVGGGIFERWLHMLN